MADDIHAVPQTAAPTSNAPQIRSGTPWRLPYSHGKRASYGLLWAAWTALLTIAGFTGLFSDQILSGLLALVLAAFAGHYDYRIWTWRARRLLFFIIW